LPKELLLRQFGDHAKLNMKVVFQPRTIKKFESTIKLIVNALSHFSNSRLLFIKKTHNFGPQRGVLPVEVFKSLDCLAVVKLHTRVMSVGALDLGDLRFGQAIGVFNRHSKLSYGNLANVPIASATGME
jgi:hypothetical protein